eukprot:s4969_g2.t1
MAASTWSWLSCPTAVPRRQLPLVPSQRPGERGLPPLAWRMLDLRHTFRFLTAGASFIRFGLHDVQWSQGSGLGEIFSRSSACLAVDDVLTRNWESWLPTETESDLLPNLQKARGRLVPELAAMAPPGGVLCNRQIVDSHAWSAKKVSKFELQELWSHVLKDRKVLVVIGSAFQVDVLEPILHLAAGAAVYFVRDAELEDVSGLLETLRSHSADFNTVLLAIESRSSALLAAGLDCTVQTLDVGALRISPAPRQQPVPSPLTTANAGSQAAWASFPRPHLKRSTDWQSLNGKWAVHISTRDQEMPPEDFEDGFVEVPFPAESHRGGLQRRISEYELLWLRREVSLPADWQRVLLHVDACDWECAVFADGSLLGIHRGGYDPFMFELAVHGGKDDTVQLTIRVRDPTDSGCEYAVDDDQPPRCDQCCQTGWQPRGKQSLQPGFIMYSAASGPWQSIWLEEAPEGCLIASAAAELLDAKRIRFEARGWCKHALIEAFL